MRALQSLFAQLHASQQSFVDPSALLRKLLDKDGKPVTIGNQEDIGVINELFLHRIGEGIALARAVKEDPLARYININGLFVVILLLLLTSSSSCSLFTGKQRTIVRAVEPDNTPVEVTHDEDFTSLVVPVGDSVQDLYQSLGRPCHLRRDLTSSSCQIRSWQRMSKAGRPPRDINFEQRRRYGSKVSLPSFSSCRTSVGCNISHSSLFDHYLYAASDVRCGA